MIRGQDSGGGEDFNLEFFLEHDVIFGGWEFEFGLIFFRLCYFMCFLFFCLEGS